MRVTIVSLGSLLIYGIILLIIFIAGCFKNFYLKLFFIFIASISPVFFLYLYAVSLGQGHEIGTFVVLGIFALTIPSVIFYMFSNELIQQYLINRRRPKALKELFEHREKYRLKELKEKEKKRLQKQKKKGKQVAIRNLLKKYSEQKKDDTQQSQ